MKALRIATRRSALALWQAEHVAQGLRAVHPSLPVELVPLVTRGDTVLDRPLALVGGKGLFLKELEVALDAGDADIAVHSCKDVPMTLAPGFRIAAILERADPADAFVSTVAADLRGLPPGARVGTSSLRRQVQVRALRADLAIVDLRGNVNTRVAKLDAGEYAAIVLACAGLERLALGARIRSRLAPPGWLPAIAQGAIAIECRDGDAATQALVAPLDHAATRRCVDAERAMGRALGANCDVPVGGYCFETADGLELHGLLGGGPADPLVRATARETLGAGDVLGQRVADRLLAERSTRH
ncbi:MAG: hydroxymethylbilane synthase [Lysobacterales bacterium]